MGDSSHVMTTITFNLPTIRGWLVGGDYDQVRQAASQQKRLLSLLTALTYDPDLLIAWRAVQAAGIAARCIAQDAPEYVRVHLRRLFWLLNDESGGIGWRAPEIMGEILHCCPGQFPEFIPLLISILDMEPEDAPPFRPGALWGIGRAAQADPQAMRPALPLALACLDDPLPQVRGMALWCLQQLGYQGDIPDSLLVDSAGAEIYLEGQIKCVGLSQLAGALTANSAYSRPA